jgi:hypothetical protein
MERKSDENFCFWFVGEQIMNETFPFLLLFMLPSIVLNWVEMRKCLDGGVPFCEFFKRENQVDGK